eukprot:8568066-Alexandrium_andersonii.AAC.1
MGTRRTVRHLNTPSVVPMIHSSVRSVRPRKQPTSHRASSLLLMLFILGSLAMTTSPNLHMAWPYSLPWMW